MTRLIAVAACDAATLESGLELLRRCAAMRVWAVELRLDYLPDSWLPPVLRERPSLETEQRAGDACSVAGWIRELIESAWSDPLAVAGGMPRLIATARRRADTGHFPDDQNEARLELLRACMDAGCDIVDIERDNYAGGVAVGLVRSPEVDARRQLPGHSSRWTTIVSEHGGGGTDDGIVAWLRESEADSILKKWSPEVKDAASLRRAFDVTQGLPDVVLSPRGGLGVAARWYADRIAMPVVYAAAPGSESRFPGMPTAAALSRVSKVLDGADCDARDHRKGCVFAGVVGAAVSRSLSPLLHHALHTGSDKTLRYAPLQCERLGDAVDVVTQVASESPICLSVTNPFKTAAAELVAESGSGAPTEGEVINTLWHRPGEGWVGANTDIGGFLAALHAIRPASRLAQDRVLLLGSGGSANSILRALRGGVRELVVSARNVTAAKTLAMKFGVSFHPDPHTDDFGFDLVVNATSCGQPGGPSANERPGDLSRLSINPGGLVYDVVYGAETPLAKQARSLGLAFEDGVSMLVQQGFLQRRAWGLDAGKRSPSVLRVIHGGIRRAAGGGAWTPLSRIALVGYRGVGKTVVAARLAEILGLPLVDLDERIARAEGASPGELIAKHGEAHFRRLEAEHLESLTRSHPTCVLATGGGIVETAAARRVLVGSYTVVWLHAEPSTLLVRLGTDHANPRPALELGGAAAELGIRLARREPWYRAVADHCVSTDGRTVEQVAAEAAAWIDGSK